MNAACSATSAFRHSDVAVVDFDNISHLDEFENVKIIATQFPLYTHTDRCACISLALPLTSFGQQHCSVQ